MKKIIALVPLLFSAAIATGCSSTSYTPTVGGSVDTLHNEVHVKDLATLTLGGFDPEKEKDPSKTYITDDDGLKYCYNAELEQYELIEGQENTTIKFYFDYNQTTDSLGNDCPIYTLKWFMMKPLGQCPEAIDSKDKVLALGAKFGFAPIQDFTNFLGFSFYSSCLGDAQHMWNYQSDIKQQAVTCLFGIWVD